MDGGARFRERDGARAPVATQRSRGLAALLATLALASAPAFAESGMRPTLSFYGTVGLIDMPTAESLPDGQMAITGSTFAGITRTTLTFQVLPRLSASFRYTKIEESAGPGTDSNFDRSFDVQYRLLDETSVMPSVAIGLRDFIGTGIFSSEYVVATKQVHPRLKLTGGLGWGRLGSRNSLGAPFGNRPSRGRDLGGEPNPNQWFRGDMGVFGGLEFKATERLNLKVEYSSDAYTRETAARIFDRESQVNFGADFRLARGVNIGAHYLYGSEFGVSVNLQFNPKEPPGGSGTEPAPPPVALRPGDGPPSTAWLAQTGGRQILRDNVEKLLAAEGLRLVRLSLDVGRAVVWFDNTRYGIAAQAMGRAARVLTAALPASVEVFVLIPMQMGMPTSRAELRRSDIEALEHAPDGAWQSYVRARIGDGAAVPVSGLPAAGAGPRFEWGLGPYVASALFDPDNPLRADFGAELTASVALRPNLVFSGSLRKRIVGNLDDVTRVSDSVLPRVRSDFGRFDREADPALNHLTAEYFTRLGPDLYGRATAGLLERMFGGVSGEVLWKPVDSRLGLGLEVNYARLRDFDVLFDFQEYDVVTGHASVYYDVGNGFSAQVDAGRYLAKDWGGTFTLMREFANNWRVGAFFTLTEVGFDEFGEGSFDKGLLLEIPLSWLTGTPSRRQLPVTIRPIQRDGGARLNVRNRLHDLVRGDHTPELESGWGRFWR